MASGRLRHAKRTKSNRTKSGQGLVEFALVGGLFFFLLFSIINAGFFLYGRNAVEHAADVGVAAIAAEGNCAAQPVNCPTPPTTTGDADQVGISRMDAAGLTTTPLTTVTEIDVWHEIEQSSGVFVDDMTCSAGGGSGTGSIACENRYNTAGTVLNSGALPWPPATRSVCGTCSGGADFAKLVITFKYTMLVGNTIFTLTTNNLFRLEPQL
jgi:TadE-like protein